MDSRQRITSDPTDAVVGALPSEIGRRHFLALLASAGVIAASPGLLAGCGADESQGARAQDLRFLIGGPFTPDWNPYSHVQLPQLSIQANLFNGLVELDPNLELQPGLAESWRQVDDRTVEFKLRDGVKFHDGRDFTAEDGKASIELASGSTDEEVVSASWWVPHEVEVVDDRTVRLRGEEPFGPLLNTLTITPVLSARDIGEGIETISEAPNGTGPFRLSKDSANTKTLEAFEQYYGNTASLRRVVWDYVQDPQTRLNALLSGQAGIVDRLEADQAEAIERRDDFKLLSVTSTEVQSLWFRMNKEPFGNNDRLRRAFAYGVDREAIVQLLGGDTRLADSHLAMGVRFREAQEPSYSFDPERARAEIEASGVQAPVSFELIGSTGFYPKSREICELATENLNEVGFDVRLTILEMAAWEEALVGEANRGEVFFGGRANVFPDPDFSFSGLFTPEGIFGVEDQRTHDLIAEGKRTVDEGGRRRVYSDLQTYLWDYLPSLPLIYSEFSNGMQADLSGYELYPTIIHKFQAARLGSGS
jgi:peptide/nickel transport system substrate-binding protein